jgi:hypothetical protein
MGKTGNIPLKNQIVQMKNRMVKELSKKMGIKNPGDAIRECLENKDVHSALIEAKKMTDEYFGSAITLDI